MSEKLTPGPHALGMEFIREGAGPNKESLGTTNLYVNDKVVDISDENYLDLETEALAAMARD